MFAVDVFIFMYAFPVVYEKKEIQIFMSLLSSFVICVMVVSLPYFCYLTFAEVSVLMLSFFYRDYSERRINGGADRVRSHKGADISHQMRMSYFKKLFPGAEE